jgi:hypothetical protein
MLFGLSVVELDRDGSYSLLENFILLGSVDSVFKTALSGLKRVLLCE